VSNNQHLVKIVVQERARERENSIYSKAKTCDTIYHIVTSRRVTKFICWFYISQLDKKKIKGAGQIIKAAKLTR